MSKSKLTSEEMNKINELIESFDFNKIHAMFTVMGYTYFDGKPDVERLKQTARSVLTEAILAYKGSDEWSGIQQSGRFSASYMPGDKELELSVVFDSKSVYL